MDNKKKVKILTELDARVQEATDAIIAITKVSGESPVTIMDALGDVIDLADGFCEALSAKVAKQEAGR